MAKVRNNLLIRGLSGDLGGQFRVNTRKGSRRTTVSALTDFDDERELSAAQLAQQQAFREASAYGKAMQEHEVYVTLADGTNRQPYNVAMADWLRRPEIREIKLVQDEARRGARIHVLAQDDVRVAEVKVEISDGEGALLFEGQALEMPALWWEFPLLPQLNGEVTVTVFAKDMPGHVTQRSEQLSLPA